MRVLSHNLKPVFSSSPHPLLHLGTGRRVPKPAGGPMAMQDYYEGQLWKQHPGIDKVVLWCVHSTKVWFFFSCSDLSLITLSRKIHTNRCGTSSYLQS